MMSILNIVFGAFSGMDETALSMLIWYNYEGYLGAPWRTPPLYNLRNQSFLGT